MFYYLLPRRPQHIVQLRILIINLSFVLSKMWTFISIYYTTRSEGGSILTYPVRWSVRLKNLFYFSYKLLIKQSWYLVPSFMLGMLYSVICFHICQCQLSVFQLYIYHTFNEIDCCTFLNNHFSQGLQCYFLFDSRLQHVGLYHVTHCHVGRLLPVDQTCFFNCNEYAYRFFSHFSQQLQIM